MQENQAGPPATPSVQPFNSPSGFLGPPVVQLPPTVDPVYAPPVVERPVANAVVPPVHPLPTPTVDILRPTTEHPFRPSRVDHRAVEYAPEYWSPR